MRDKVYIGFRRYPGKDTIRALKENSFRFDPVKRDWWIRKSMITEETEAFMKEISSHPSLYDPPNFDNRYCNSSWAFSNFHE